MTDYERADGVRWPGWTPCLADPDGFDCAECAVGWLSHCRYRSDETLRDFHSQEWRRRHGLIEAANSPRKIMQACIDVLRLQGLAMPAPLVHLALPTGVPGSLAETMAAMHVAPEIEETSPGMFRYRARSSVDDVGLAPLAVTRSGAAIEQILADNPPWQADDRLLGFRRLRGMELLLVRNELRVTRSALEKEVEQSLGHLLQRRGWDEVLTLRLATTALPVPPAKDVALSAETTKLLRKLCAIELSPRWSDCTEVQAAHSRLRNELTMSNVRLVGAAARRWARGGQTSFADLFQYGVGGLMRAVEGYDPWRGFVFSTYAVWWIRQAIDRAIADNEQLVRVPVHAVTLARSAVSSLSVQADSESIVELARQALAPHDSVAEAPLRSRMELADALDSVEMRAVLSPLIKGLHGRQRRVIELRYGIDGLAPRTLEETGKHLGITREAARQLEQKALKRMRALAELPAHAGRPADVTASADDSRQ